MKTNDILLKEIQAEQKHIKTQESEYKLTAETASDIDDLTLVELAILHNKIRAKEYLITLHKNTLHALTKELPNDKTGSKPKGE